MTNRQRPSYVRWTPAELEEQTAGMPPEVAAVARKWPADTCYRCPTLPRDHYWVYSYEEHPPGIPVTLKVVHGADSRTPGICVFGFDPTLLVECNCRQWEMPTQEECERVASAIRAAGEAERARKRQN